MWGIMSRRRNRGGCCGAEIAVMVTTEGKRGDASPRDRRGGSRLVRYEELPDYLKDNEYILDYYRSEWPLWDAVLSAFLWHNETLNIWTHLGGFLLFLTLTVAGSLDTLGAVAAISRTGNATLARIFVGNGILEESLGASEEKAAFLEEWAVPRWPRLVFMVGSMMCLACSTISHLLACHSRRFNYFFWSLDYAGISLMIVTSFFPPIYYAFFCHPYSRLFYLSTISVLGVLSIFVLMSPALNAPHFRKLRASLFLAMGFSGVVPAVHAIALYWEHRACHVAVALEVAMAVAYGAGAWVYVNRVPERWRPGAFDLAGHSHQIFHVFVVVGALVHYAAVAVLLDWRERQPCSASAPGGIQL